MGAEHRAIGLGVHQAVEFLLGVFLVISSTRVTDGGGGVLLGLGVALLVLPAVTSGPLAAVRLLSPAVHRVLDVLLVMLAAASPLLPLGVSGSSVLLVVLTAAAMAVLTRATTYAARRRRRGAPRTVGPAPAAAPRPSQPPPAWARGLGTAAGRARRQVPRQAGRMVGRVKKGRPERP